MSDSDTPWTAAHQASLFFTISQSLLKFMSIETVMLSNHLILCHPFSFCLQFFPASGSFPLSQLFTSDGQSIDASASVLPVIIQDWFPLGWTGWISLHSKGFSRIFFSTTVQNINSLTLSLRYALYNLTMVVSDNKGAFIYYVIK